MDIAATDSLPTRVWLNDLDMFLELSNGRQLMLYDLGRTKFAARIGLLRALRREGWGLAVAGSFIRYRKRLTLFQTFEMRTRFVGRDGRFLLLEQAMWRGETCHSHLLIRTVVTGPDGVVDPSDVADALGYPRDIAQQLPDWVHGMLTAESGRPWPPEV